MDYKGTAGNDDIDQAALGLPAGSNLLGGAGDDTIKVTVGNGVGEEGNDTIIGSTDWSGAAYWTSPAGVTVNLAAGTAQDGYGTTDKLQNIRVIQDSGHNDSITGSGANEEFWLSWGNDTVAGGGGSDTVKLYNVKSTEVKVTYDLATDTFTLVKNTAAGDKGTSKLSGITRISFTGPQSDNVDITRDMFDYSDGFLRSSFNLPLTDSDKIAQMRAADFNGDGKQDILIVRLNPDLGLTAEPLQILLGDGTGKFTDGTASIFSGGTIPKINYVPRIFAADFNKDGISDIFNPDFGYDAPPFPGGQNSYYLSNPGTKLLESATASLPQALLQSHGTSIGDINRDGYPDVLVNVLNDSTGQSNQVLINDGTGHFVNNQSLLPSSLRQTGFKAGYTWSMLRDINNDGWDDMVLGTWDGNGGPSLVVLNNGQGSFATSTPIALPATGLTGQIIIGIETIDLNGDALPDLVLSATNGGSHSEFYKVPYLQLLVNEGNGHFRDETAARLPQSKEVTSTSANWYLSATPVDLNGDGFQDIVTHANNPYAGSRVFMNDGTGKFVDGWRGGNFVNVLPIDVNGDGKTDMVEASYSGLSVLMNAFPNRVPASGTYRAGDSGERIAGGSAAETIYSGKGNDVIDAGTGVDTVVYSGNRSLYTIKKADGSFTVSGTQGSDTLTQVERLAFGDVSIALDIDGVAGQAYRVYEAAFNRPSDNAGLGYWIDSMDKGATLEQVAGEFVKSEEFQGKFAGKTNAQIVDEFYSNILNRTGEPAGTAWWIEQLNAGNATLAQVLVGFSEAPENKANLVGITQNGIEFAPWG